MYVPEGRGRRACTRCRSVYAHISCVCLCVCCAFVVLMWSFCLFVGSPEGRGRRANNNNNNNDDDNNHNNDDNNTNTTTKS